MRDRALKWFLVVLGAAVPLAAAAQEHVVSQKNRQFAPKALTAKVGEPVNFKNDDSVYHNVFSLSKALSFDLRAMAPGQSRKVEMVREGVIDVECAIHPEMKLQIKVVR